MMSVFPVVVSAEPDELKFFLQDFEIEKEEIKGYARLFWGTYKGNKLGLACLGVGKTNAAAGTALVIESMKPDALFMVGASGALSPVVAPGDVIVGTGLVDRDGGYLTTKGFVPGGAWLYDKTQPYYPSLVREITPDRELMALAKTAAICAEDELDSFGERKARLHFGPIATGDLFVAAIKEKNTLFSTYQALAAEMEGAALAQTAYALDIPFLVIRGISDHADDSIELGTPKVYQSNEFVEDLWRETRRENSDPMQVASEAAKSLHSVFQKASYNASIIAWSIIKRLPLVTI